MARVDYDRVAPSFERRYAHNSFAGVQHALERFVGSVSHRAVVEIGCGTGHWLRVLAGDEKAFVGVDRSKGMLERARTADPRGWFVLATAEHLPLANSGFDRVFCINALHHFGDQPAFLRECRRILTASGAFLTIALDPHTGVDQWWVYDYFPGALAADLLRYSPCAVLRRQLEEAGFELATTEIVHHVPAERPFELARQQGLLDRQSTSQLMVISDSEYQEGIRRLHKEQPVLRSNLRLFGTIGYVQESSRAIGA